MTRHTQARAGFNIPAPMMAIGRSIGLSDDPPACFTAMMGQVPRWERNWTGRSQEIVSERSLKKIGSFNCLVSIEVCVLLLNLIAKESVLIEQSKCRVRERYSPSSQHGLWRIGSHSPTELRVSTNRNKVSRPCFEHPRIRTRKGRQHNRHDKARHDSASLPISPLKG